MRRLLDNLHHEKLTFGDLVLFVSDPANKLGSARWDGFFSIPGRVEQVLDFWASSGNSPTGRKAIQAWAVQFVKDVVSKEGHKATRSRTLYARNMAVDTSFVLDFSMERIRKTLLEMCPTVWEIFQAFSTTRRQQKDLTMVAEKRKSIALIGLNARSQNNSYVQQVFGLYAYASGAQRQVMSVLSHLGITCSYPTLTGSTPAEHDAEGNLELVTADSTPRDSEPETLVQRVLKRSVGLLKLLSDSSMSVAQRKAQSHRLANVYDNINMLFKVAEQILGRKDALQNGTCATAFELHDASLDDMRTADVVESLAHAPPLSLEDVLLSSDENALLTRCLEHTVLRIIVTYGGERFARFRKEVEATVPVTEDQIPLHKTEIYPLPAMNIDESSTTGNADVLCEIYKALKLDIDSPDFTQYVKVISGDQLSISRIRSLIQNRAGHETLGRSFLWALCMPGLFHYKMAATHGLLESHFGSSSQRDPGSLAFHNTVLDRKPIVLTSLPPFRTSRDLIFVSLYARVLHCLLQVSGCSTLDEYALKVTFPELCVHVKTMIAEYASASVAQDLREQRDEERRMWESTQMDVDDEVPGVTATPGVEDSGRGFVPKTGDMVFENAVLFMRDALTLREFNDAVKAGDSGRVVNILKLWTLSFRGSGRLKYAYEMLHLIHNLTHVWPAPLRKIILNNWLVNPTGKPNAWVEVDLMQEHLNFWIKTIYKAHGSNASWEWLVMISPCVDILRQLATQVNADLGAHQGTKHTSPDLEKDIAHLMESLQEHGVYSVDPGRCVDEVPKSSVPNIVALGCAALSGPLADFNKALAHLQQRCLMKPLGGMPYAGATVTVPSNPTTSPCAAAARPSSPSKRTQSTTAEPPVALALQTSSSIYSPEDEECYWNNMGALPWEEADGEDDVRNFFTLDSAGDVALDMDAFDDELSL
ncbi:hypothetical protein PYCCODRAFT_1449702 [Trametes coccinea BRFM310]|uniref:DUF6589 domain-containing protein n=1 Tax=Trametes coccinea (strain BRFM310) TaxID=1353009 RepID=A0A1Y2J416_TRAC3|nr:hypothetical protein PYCCODRAFT_1449702 [Trametes coccinea BRFM310]